MLASANGQEANERNLHARQRPQRIPRGVCDIEAQAEPSHTDENKSVERNEAGNEGIAAPGGDHVAVEERTKGTPKDGAQLQGLDPEEEGEDEEENGDSFVIIGTSNGTRDVSRGNAHKSGGEEAGG